MQNSNTCDEVLRFVIVVCLAFGIVMIILAQPVAPSDAILDDILKRGGVTQKTIYGSFCGPVGLVRHTQTFYIAIYGDQHKLWCELDGINVTDKMRIGFGIGVIYGEYLHHPIYNVSIPNGDHIVTCYTEEYNESWNFSVDNEEPMWTSCTYNGSHFIANVSDAHIDFVELLIYNPFYILQMSQQSDTIWVYPLDIPNGISVDYTCRAMDVVKLGSYYIRQKSPIFYDYYFEEGWNMISLVMT